jgi:N-carbamoylputrescine amidase
MPRLKVAVCEAPPELYSGTSEWRDLCRAVAAAAPELLLLNEMPFGSWIAAGAAFEEAAWQESLAAHEQGLRHLGELGAPVVAATRPALIDGQRVNEAFLWTAEGGLRGTHTKQYFPDEEGYYEARWFAGGERHFRLAPLGSAGSGGAGGAATGTQCGFLICTELMFNERARRYGRSGAHLILAPRAAGAASLGRWLVAARMAAIVSGGYVLSSNRAGTDARGQRFGGAGWIVDPAGDLLAETSAESPVVCREIDTDRAARAQREYPCYVKE